MDLEHLTKHQIVLLTLLVSFVTSIATGIVTVSLMSQAPISVTRTINQIVERTVQTVVPSQGAASVSAAKPSTNASAAAEDLATRSISKVQKSIIRITVKGGSELVARGVIVDPSGTALTDKAALVNSGAQYFDAILADGTRVPLTLRDKNATTSIAVVDAAVGTSTAFAPAVFADQSKLQLGQSVIRIGGSGVDSVGVGVIATLPAAQTNSLEATVDASTPGSVLITTLGEVIAITTNTSLAKGATFYSLATPPAIKTSL